MRNLISDRKWLLLITTVILVAGFALISLLFFGAARDALNANVLATELPISADTIAAEISKALSRPILISSMMASDTFLRDWVVGGEKDPATIEAYLLEVREANDAFATFFVSERTKTYYYYDGVLKRVSPDDERDAWYFRVRGMNAPYEVNVDPDQANADTLTIFINYRVLDFEGRFIGAAGIGISVDSLKRIATDYYSEYAQTVRFVDETGAIVTGAEGSLWLKRGRESLRDVPGLGAIADKILSSREGSFEYDAANGRKMLLTARWVPEFRWIMLVEREERALPPSITRAILLDLGLGLAMIAVVIFSTLLTINLFQSKLERAAATDQLTGLLNRQGFMAASEMTFGDRRRRDRPLCVAIGDLDHFKRVNDSYGHDAGDFVLKKTAAAIRESLRSSDVCCRWGGEEFLVLLPDCPLENAVTIMEKARAAVENASKGRGREKVTMSVGVAEWRRGEDFEATVKRADAALYKAKNDGRDRLYSA